MITTKRGHGPSRRRVLSAALAAALPPALATVGCSSRTVAESGDGKSFEFWSFTGINQGLTVEVYEKLRPDIDVTLTEVGGSVETAQALTIALAGGKVPDLALIQADDMPRFVDQPQNLRDLRDFGADEIKGDYLDWVISQAIADNGAIVGIPTDVGGMAIAYRKDLFEEAGFPTDREEVGRLWPTWEDFIATGERYTATTGKPFLDNAPTSIFYQAVNQVSRKYYDDDGNAIYGDNPEVREAFELALRTIEAGITARLSSFTEGWSAALQRGVYAVVATPSWMLNSIRSTAPNTEGKWDLTTIPGGAGNWGGSYLAIPANAANPEPAWDYIRRMQSPEGQLEHFTRAGALPTTPSVYDRKELAEHTDPFFSNAPIGQLYTDSLLGLEPFPVGPDSAPIGQEFLNALTDVEQGGADPAKAWDTALHNIKVAIGE